MSLETIQFDSRVFDDWPAMVWILDTGGQPIYLNKIARAFAGCEDPTELPQPWSDLVVPEDREAYEAALRQSLNAGEAYSLDYKRRNADGAYHRLVERGTPMEQSEGVYCGVFCLVTDLTAGLFSETASSATGAVQVELLSQVTHDVLWDWDLRTNTVLCNAAFIATFGEPPREHEAAHAWWKERAHPDDVEPVVHLYDEAFKTGKTNVSYEYRIRSTQGAWVTLDSRARLIRDASGEVIRVLVASRDISNRRRAEEAQARLTRILEATTDYVGLGTVDGRPLYINAAGRKMIGVEPEEALDFHVTHSHPDWANEILLKEAIPTAIRDGYWQGENAMRHHVTGREFPVSQVVLAHRDADGKVEFLSTIVRDLSDRKREEIERIEWANRYDAAIRASGQILFDWNSTNNEITYAGDTERMFGYSVTEMAGGLERFRQLIHPEDLPRFNQRVQEITATRDPFHLQFRIRHKANRWVYLEARGYFFLDRRGHIGRMVGFFADVTSQRKAQEALAQAHENLEQRVIERTAELARLTAMLEDRAHRQEIVAQLGQRALTGMPLSRLMDEAVQAIPPVLRVDRCALLALTQDGQELIPRAQSGWPDMLTRNRVPTGRQSQSGYTLLTGSPVVMEDAARETRFTVSQAIVEAGLKSGLSVPVTGSEGPLGVLATFTMEPRSFDQEDIHFLQSVANVLTAAIQRERAEESIRQAREQAELASRAKSEFLSRMSHELRTPLNAILGFTQLLELEDVTPSQAESVQHISHAGRHLLSLINEVLDISRIDAGRFALNLEPIDIREFLDEALDRIRPLAQEHKIAVTLEPAEAAGAGPFVQSDRQRLHQVMFNLLSNAVIYNRPDGRVTLSYHAEGPRMRLTVTDTGRGIEADRIARLFLPFERLGAESTDVEGVGIGLALSRRIVTALQGELNVESRVGEGSRFWVILPLAEQMAPQREATAAVVPSPTSESPEASHPAPSISPHYKLLYIEDQDLNTRLVERILDPLPEYRLLTAPEGGAGLALAREHQPNLILLDLNLPDMSGDEVLRRLKSDTTVSHIPVIMVTADVMSERIENLLKNGASGYLTKPYKLDQFLKVIENTLASH